MGLDTVELVIDIEKEYSIEISDDDAATLGIVGDLARYIVNEVKVRNSVELQFEPVLRRIIDILVDNYEIPRQNINSTSHVVRDLGLD